MSTLELNYQRLLREVLQQPLRTNRTETRTKAYFAAHLNFFCGRAFPLITGKFIDFRIIEAEFDWFINGSTTTDLFKERNIKIWDAWADEHGNLGPVYGYQMLNYNGSGFNQLDAVQESLKNDPNSRRHIITLWNPLQLKEMALPPCYLYFQFFVSGEILNMHVTQRSGDLFAGVPYDMGLFAYFLIYMAHKVKKYPGMIDLTIVDAHIYEDHIEGVNQYLGESIYAPPTWQYGEDGRPKLFGYNHGPRIKIKIAK